MRLTLVIAVLVLIENFASRGACAQTGTEALRAAGGGGGLQPLTKRVYVATLDGELGTTLAPSLVRVCLGRAVAERADVVVFRLDCAAASSEKEADVAEMTRVIGHEIGQFQAADAKDAGAARRVVLWLERAEGTAGLLTLVVSDVVFAPGASVGPIPFIENWARETELRSREMCTLGNAGERFRSRVERTAVSLGHPARVVSALLRPGGSLRLRADGSHELVETPPARYPDDDLPPLSASQFLSLDAVGAEELGFSLGTADTLRGVLRALGYSMDGVDVVREGAAVQAWRSERTRVVEAYVRHLDELRTLLKIETRGITELERIVELLEAMVRLEKGCADELAAREELPNEGWAPMCLGLERKLLRRLRVMTGGLETR